MKEHRHAANHVEHYLNKHRGQPVHELINRRLLLCKQLERSGRNVVVYSDLHGSYEKYIFWLKAGLGYIRIIMGEILGSLYDDGIANLYARLILLENRSRIEMLEEAVRDKATESYAPKLSFARPIPALFPETLRELEARGIRRVRVIEDLVHVLREITRHDEHRVIKIAPEFFRENMMSLYLDAPRTEHVRQALIQGIVENDHVYLLMADLLARVIDLCIVDKHVNLGDTMDRGEDADYLLRMYRTYFDKGAYSPWLHYIWGNHDILWLGASIGNPVLVATALRVSLRYSNFGFCRRYGFDLSALREYALRLYGDRPTGAYAKRIADEEWGEDDILKMIKVLQVIEAKLAASETRAAASEDSRLKREFGLLADHYEALLKLIPTGVAEDEQAAFLKENPLYSDCFFPTVMDADRARLTDEEQQIVYDLVEQFMTLPEFRKDMQYLMWKGEMYRVVDDTLYYHAAMSATEDGGLVEVGGLSGRALFDFLQPELKRIGDKARLGRGLSAAERHLFFYLWCGPDSPLFCKNKMATLERAILNKPEAAKDPLTTWSEGKNPFYTNIRDEAFINMLLAEFHAQNLCMGHTPIKDLEDGILSDDLKAFIVDGGASGAYGDRGAVMIKTPENTYLTLNPSLDDLRQAADEATLYEPTIQRLEERSSARMRDTETGYFLQAELKAIDQLLARHLPPYMARHVEKRSPKPR